MAHFSQDPLLCDAISKGSDVIRSIAAGILRVPEQEITTQQRSHAKSIIYGIMYESVLLHWWTWWRWLWLWCIAAFSSTCRYGMGDAKLAEQMNVTIAEAEAFRTRFLQRYEGELLQIVPIQSNSITFYSTSYFSSMALMKTFVIQAWMLSYLGHIIHVGRQVSSVHCLVDDAIFLASIHQMPWNETRLLVKPSIPCVKDLRLILSSVQWLTYTVILHRMLFDCSLFVFDPGTKLNLLFRQLCRSVGTNVQNALSCASSSDWIHEREQWISASIWAQLQSLCSNGVSAPWWNHCWGKIMWLGSRLWSCFLIHLLCFD